MRGLLIFFFILPLWGQSEALKKKKKKLYHKITQSVAAPCCNNMIPVAFHESQWAFEIRDFVEARILAGDKESAIFDQLEGLTFGPEKKHVTFTIPDRDGLGYLAWASPAILILLGVVAALLLMRRRRTSHALTDDELLAKYSPLIRSQL